MGEGVGGGSWNVEKLEWVVVADGGGGKGDVHGKG